MNAGQGAVETPGSRFGEAQVATQRLQDGEQFCSSSLARQK
jgi:hypothetical protein